MAAKTCVHITNDLQYPEPNTPEGCEECLATGGRWVHLRLCLQCGHVGCCDNSPGKHATKHFHKTEHPVIASYEPGENWVWCYVDEVFAETAASVR
ncbi:MAG TPA: UBP-type zinc finger domain-containing protein [Candidatus Dormibacteraeota bacterium]|nr:UBP-type zinc finger domain-containing protein [Candidatus Dormibacteraeota bacterium]